ASLRRASFAYTARVCMMATSSESPIVSGTKMKWYTVVMPNCHRARSRASMWGSTPVRGRHAVMKATPLPLGGTGPWSWWHGPAGGRPERMSSAAEKAPCAILAEALFRSVPGGGTSRRRDVGAPATRTTATAVLPRSASQRFHGGAARRGGLETSVLSDDDQTGPGCAGPPAGDGRMADSTREPENGTSEAQTPPPARRRRGAGAPAGAAAFTPPTVPEPESTAPRTVVAAQE